MSMPIYPQLQTGALSQYPVGKTRRQRTVVNEAPDGSTVRLSDAAGGVTEWALQYEGISDSETAALEQLFADLEGSLQGFTFLDPCANLLAWSGRLDADVWQKDPLLTATEGIDDPAGGTAAWRLVNAGAAGQSVAQTLQVPGQYTYCFSVYARAEVPLTVRLSIGGAIADRVVASNWGRITMAATGTTGTESLRFAVEIPAGATAELYGPQVEAQGGASVYRASTRGGVYEDAHLRDDVLRVTRTGFNRNSCTVNIIHGEHL